MSFCNFRSAYSAINAKNLSLTAKAVLIAIAHRADLLSNKTCFPSYKTIAEDASCSVSTVKNQVNILEELGYITVERRRRKNGSYTSSLFTLNKEKLNIQDDRIIINKELYNNEPRDTSYPSIRDNLYTNNINTNDQNLINNEYNLNNIEDCEDFQDIDAWLDRNEKNEILEIAYRDLDFDKKNVVDPILEKKFEELEKLYPIEANNTPAKKLFVQTVKTPEEANRIISDLKNRIRNCAQWQTPKFIPFLYTFIKKRYWELPIKNKKHTNSFSYSSSSNANSVNYYAHLEDVTRENAILRRKYEEEKASPEMARNSIDFIKQMLKANAINKNIN